MSLPAFFTLPRRSRAVTVATRLCSMVAVCASALLFSLPSHAQDGYPGYGNYPPSHVWVVTYQSSGGGSYVSLNSSPATSTTIPVPWPPTSGSLSILTNPAQVSAQAAGTVTATLTWYPAGGDRVADPPPPLVNLRVTAKASQSHGGWAGGGLPPANAGFADNGWGNPGVSYAFGGSDIETRLIQCDGSSGVIVLDPVTLAAACPLTTWLSTGPDWLWTDTIILSLDVQEDPRKVQITSTDIETSYFKTDDEHGGSPYQTSHKRNSDGSIITDSAVSPPLNQPGGGTTWTASPILMAQAAGFQNPSFTWSLTGDGSLPTAGNSSQTELSVSFPDDNAAAMNLNKQSTVRVDVQDSDFATATNTFTVRWHYPYENWGNDPKHPPMLTPTILPAYSALPTSVNMPGSLNARFVYGNYWTSLLLQSGKIATDVGGIYVKVELYKTLLKVMGLGADNLQQSLKTTDQTIPLSSSDVWDDTIDYNPSNGSTFSPEPARDGTEMSPAVKNKYQMSNPQIYIGYTTFWYIGDSYDTHGYAGQASDHEQYLLPGSDIHYVADFTLNSKPPGGGGS